MILHKKGYGLILCGAAIFIFVLLPLLFLQRGLADLKFKVLLEEGRLEECVTFRYGGNRQVRCFTSEAALANGDDRGYVFLPSFADLDALQVETSAFRVEFVREGEVISISRKEETLCSFEEQVPYSVHFYDRRGREAGVKTMIFLKSASLPTLYVNTETGSMEKLDADKTYKEGASAELVGPDGRVLFQNELKNISGRGNHTFMFEKKSYQINLESPKDFLGMGASDTWILLCNVFDRSYIRNKLTYDMALEAGMPGSPRSEYIDVYFNGVYHGMYLLCEKVEIGENRLELADLGEQNRLLNGPLDKAYRFANEDNSRKGVELLRNPEDITGGYLVEHDYGPKYQEVISGFITESGEHFAVKSPKYASREQVDYIAERMQAIETAIMAEDGCDPDTGAHFSEYLDLESWADKYLVEEITRNNGGGLTSSYFYKPRDSVSTRVFGGPVWDYDKAYGRVGGNDAEPRLLSFLMQHIGENTHWFSYLYQQEEFVEAVKNEYEKKFSAYLTVMAEEKAEEYLDRISASAVLDEARFLYVYMDYGGEMDFRAEAERVTDFIRERKQFLDEVWLNDAPVCQVSFLDKRGEELYRLGVIQGETVYELPEEHESFVGWKIGEELLTGPLTVTEDLTVSGVWE